MDISLSQIDQDKNDLINLLMLPFPPLHQGQNEELKNHDGEGIDNILNECAGEG